MTQGQGRAPTAGSGCARDPLRLASLVTAFAVGVGACSAPTAGMPPTTTARTTATTTATPRIGTATPSPATTTSAAPPSPTSVAPPSPVSPTPTGPTPSDGAPVVARLSIPALGVDGLVVEPYEGWTDDAPGTRIQDRGLAASPFGPRGGTGPGGVGSYQVTAHRTTGPAPFRDLPGLPDGSLVDVDAAGVRYTYAVTETRRTSFRAPVSLAEQRAPVPGHPGVTPTQAVILLSTCATPEDHAEGNTWADELHNPEHRIDKVAVLVATAPAPGV